MKNKKILRVAVVHLINPKSENLEAEQDLTELKSLIQTVGGTAIVRVIQRRDYPDHTTYIGKGKAQELADTVKEDAIDVVIINDVIKPGQLFELRKIIEKKKQTTEVWDRVDLILHIFDKHAHTAEAKLQIELAKMRHMGPRIYGMGMVLSRQGGGIGTLGIGETNTELMKRHWRNAMKKVQDQLDRIAKNREQQLNRRKRIGLPTVSIVGYTNAGKTSLFNSLSGKKNLAANVLFATLDSSVGKLYLSKINKEILLSDTIGFIQNLPTRLIEAFKSTLMESIHADLLLHVIDASDPRVHEKISIVEGILQDLHIITKDQIYIFNKIDVAIGITPEEILKYYGHQNPIFVSVKTGDGIKELQDAISRYFMQKNPTVQL